MIRKGTLLPWTALAALAMVGACLRLAGLPHAERGDEPGRWTGHAAPEARSSQKHYVTPRQLLASNAMVQSSVEGLEADAGDGRRLTWEGIGGGRPVVLVFVKEGCPCNAEFEPFIRRVERLYGDSARFAGVIDAGPESAHAYAEGLRIDRPILADPDRRIIGRFGAENGGYIALVTPDGVIDGFWPGCSADGMKELGRRIAHLSGRDERPLDVEGMPGPLTTGCPFGS
jgi:peroxiredoxin